MDKNIIIRRILATVGAFILSIALFALSLTVSASLASSQRYIKQTEKRSHYASLSFSQLKERLADLTIPSGLPIDFFDSRLDYDLYAERVGNYFDTVAEQAPLSFTAEDVTKEFYDLAHEYALTQNRVISDEAKLSLQGFAEECRSVYMLFVSPSSVRYVLTALPSLRTPALYGTAISALLAAGSGALLFMLCRRRDAAKHFFFSFAAAALMSGAVPALLLMTNEVERVSISSASLHSLTVSFVEGALWMLLAASLVFALVAALTLYVSHLSKKRKNVS